MLISQAIAQSNALTGQVVENAVLVRWLSEIDGRLAFEFYRTDAWAPYDPTDDLNCELLVPFPWDGFYIHHLAAQTYFANGEYDRYENERVMSEKTLADFRSFMQRTQAALCGCGFPTEKAGGTGITVIPGDECHSPWFWLSAYALAVKHGFKGTEDEWLEQQLVYVAQAQEAASDANAAANRAEDATAHPPIIGENGNWYYWNGAAYTDSNKPSRGEKGDDGAAGSTGAAAGFGTPTATVDGNVGTPAVTVTASGPDTAKIFAFEFNNIKGATGSTGPKGDKGDKGDTGAKGDTGTTGPKGDKGDKGDTGATGPQGIQGPQGERGAPFAIAKTYISIAAMEADYSGTDVGIGEFVLIDTGDVEDPDNAKLYYKGTSDWVYLTDLSGTAGIQGPQGPQGVQGQAGPAGQDGADGVSPEVTISTITGGHSVKITDADHPTGQTFNVMDGQDGSNGSDGADGTDGVSPSVSVSSISGGHTVTITDKNHPDGQSFNVMDGEDGAQGPQGETGATGPQGPAGPNTVTTSTTTNLTGILKGNGSAVSAVANGTTGQILKMGASGPEWGEAPATVSPSSSTPQMNGVGNAGSSANYSRGDHVHPTDSSRQAKITASGVLQGDGNGGVTAKPVDSSPAAGSTNLATSGMVKAVEDEIPAAYASNPAMDGTASPGSSSDYARGDHVHPTDTSLQAKITASGVLVGDGNGGVSAKTLDTSSLSNDNAHIPSSGVVKSTLTSLENGLATIHATGTNNTTGAIIPAGTYFYLNGSLVKAKENIGIGAPFTSDNYAAVTAGGLNELKAALCDWEDIKSQCTWNSDLTFTQKMAYRVGNWVTVWVIVAPTGIPSTQYSTNIVTLPSPIAALGTHLSMAMCDTGSGVPSLQNAADLVISDNGNVITLKKLSPSASYVWGEITFPIRT